MNEYKVIRHKVNSSTDYKTFCGRKPYTENIEITYTDSMVTCKNCLKRKGWLR